MFQRPVGLVPWRRGSRPRRLPLVLAALVVPLLAACGSGGSAPATINPHLPMAEVSVANVGSLGRILVDGNGHTLYAYSPDHHSGQSKCFGVCAAAWPPLELAQGTTTPTAGPGLHSQLLGTTKRGPNLQVTYDGWPLYRWAADTRAGQATGQGLFNAGGYWYVLRSSGKLVT